MKNSGLRVSATKWKNGLSAHRPKTISAAEPQSGRNERLGEFHDQSPMASAGEGAGHHQKRRDREILEEKHREARAADRRAEPLALDQDRDHDRGRRHAERGGDDQRGGRRETESRRRRGEDERGDDDLAQPQAKHQPPHETDSLERQLEAHREQQRDDAERGDPVDRLDIADGDGAEPRRPGAERAEAERSQRHPAEQIAEHRADAQAEEQRRDAARHRQEQQRFSVEIEVECLVHGLRRRPPTTLIDSSAGASLAGRALRVLSRRGMSLADRSRR